MDVVVPRYSCQECLASVSVLLVCCLRVAPLSISDSDAVHCGAVHGLWRSVAGSKQQPPVLLPCNL
eukprot:2004193-Amphidinium_carterae.1